MIHTARFYLQLDDTEIVFLCRKFKEKITLLSKVIDENFEGITTTFTNRFRQWWMFVNIDFIKLLGKSNIQEKDVKEIQQKIDQYLFFIFGKIHHKELTLVRIDFRYDAVISNKEHRELLLKLYKKTTDKYGFKIKNDRYKSTIYFNSKSVKVICYDKEKERSDKNVDIEPYEKNVLRFEVCLLNRHLNYMKKTYGLEKCLESYMNDEFWAKYMKGNICPIFFKGDYYKINTATKIIEESNFKDRDKKKLRNFLCDVSKYGIHGVKRLMVKDSKGILKPKYSKYLFSKYIGMLEELNINPILIPKNYKVAFGKDKFISNPLDFLQSS